MNVFEELRTNITRRHFFAQGSHAVGWAALSMLLGRDSDAGDGAAPTSLNLPRRPQRDGGPSADAFPRQGQARHLPAHGRRPAATGPV